MNRRAFIIESALAAAASLPVAVGAAEPKPPGIKVTILGNAGAIPEVGHEAACFLINGKHLVDAGYCGVLRMRQYGFDPLALESITFTHFHMDHYLGLPQLLFYLGLRGRKGPPFQISGPREHLESIVNTAVEFLRIDEFPELKVDYRLLPLSPGDTFEISGLHMETFAARHVSGKDRPEPALVYKATDTAGGAVLAFTGDTHFHPPTADFFKGAHLLIHDAAHTPIKDVVGIAQKAEVGKLLLIHHPPSKSKGLLETARSVFPNTEIAEEGKTFEIPAIRREASAA